MLNLLVPDDKKLTVLKLYKPKALKDCGPAAMKFGEFNCPLLPTLVAS